MKLRDLPAFEKLAYEGGDPKREVWLADWQAYDLPYCSVYVIGPESGWPCKIGMSSNVKKRLMGVQVSVWMPCRVHWCGWTSSRADARRLEQAMHAELRSQAKSLRGEWFDVRPEQAADMILFRAALDGVEISTEVEDERVIEGIAAAFKDFNMLGGERQKRLAKMRVWQTGVFN